MKIYKKSTRNGQDTYTCFEGVTEATVIATLEALGHTNIQDSTEQEYLENAYSV